MSYRIEVRYAAFQPEDASQIYEGLDANRADGTAEAFLRDLFKLEGAGVTSVMVAHERRER